MRGQGGMGGYHFSGRLATSVLVVLSYVELDKPDDSLSGAVRERANRVCLLEKSQFAERSNYFGHKPKSDGQWAITAIDSPQGPPVVTLFIHFRRQNKSLTLRKIWQ